MGHLKQAGRPDLERLEQFLALALAAAANRLHDRIYFFIITVDELTSRSLQCDRWFANLILPLLYSRRAAAAADRNNPQLHDKEDKAYT